ncbi:MAG: hydrogen peroxide-inducible genes activator [Rhodospirillales bacterium]
MEPPVTIKQLSAFLQIAEAGSIRRAAEIGSASQPTLSAQLASLEATVRLRLFERRANGMLLTPDGRKALEMARRVLDSANEIAALANREGQGIEATIALGVSTSIGPYLLPAATRDLHRAHPGLRLSVREGSTRSLTQDLLAGTHDLILTQLPLSDETIRHGVLLREALFVMMAADHPLAERSTLSLEDLAGQRFLTLGPNFALTTQVERLCREAHATASYLYEGNSMDALRIMCAMSSDVAVVPEFYVRSEVVGDSGVTVRKIQRPALSRSIVLAWRQSQGEPAFVAPLLQAIQATGTRLRKTALVLPEDGSGAQ